MQRWLVALASIACFLWLFQAPLAAQVQPPSDKLLVDASVAYTWTDGKSDIIQLQGPVTIRLDRMELTAKQAVIWLSPEPGVVIEQQRAEIALIGDASVREPGRDITRSGDRLFVTVAVRGDIRISADERLTGDQTATALYRQADSLRRAATVNGPSPSAPLQPATAESGTAQTPTVPARGGTGSIWYHANRIETVPIRDGTETLALTGDVAILRTDPRGNHMEIQSDRAVLFTHEKSRDIFQDSGGGAKTGISGAYLEGDVRINYTPAEKTKPEGRLRASRAYYDFDREQAVLTDAVLRTSDPSSQMPITIRAQTLRQLSEGEYRGQHVELSTSSFATPTYSIKTDQVYIRQDEIMSDYTGQPEMQTKFIARGDTLSFFDAPLFYFPQASGSVDEDPFPLRTIDIAHTSRLGQAVSTEFGLYELMGKERPPGLDVSVLGDYFSRRGPATGLNATYSGSNINQDNDELSDFNGRIRSFLITDHGTDKFGEDRTDVDPPDQLRGKFLFEHQQFMPDHWQAQLRLGYASDPTFLEEYFPKDFYDNQQYDAEAYLKRQEETEAITIALNADTNRFVTTSDQTQEQFDVEKLPEVGYHRIGDSFADDSLTFFSDNTADRLRFADSHASLADQGYVGISPGLPSEGYTGTRTSPVYRGDSRQEVDYPVQLGLIKMVPYAVGRATAYSNTPQDDSLDRVFGAVGVRFTTDFWKVDDEAESDLFDIHRVRHIVEPEVNLFSSGETLDRTHFFVYDENIDGISDISAAELALHQRWETYRGAPGKEQSVDFLSINVSADVFTNPPTDPGILPDKFRGIYFPSDPEASIPRDAINDDLTWLISDSTALLADSDYNVDHQTLATASVGMAAERYDRLAYYLGLRYIEQLNSDIATFAVQYQLTAKYSVEFSQGYDFGQNQNVSSEVTLRRSFDRLTAEVSVYHDSTTGDSGLNFNIYPTGLGPTGSAPDIGSFFSTN